MAEKQRIDMTLKLDHIKYLKERAEKYGISVSAANDMIIEDAISQDKLRERVTAQNIKS